MKRKVEQYANGGDALDVVDALSPRQVPETTKRQHTGLDNDGASPTSQTPLLLSLPLEIRLQIWEEATYTPSSLVRLHDPYRFRPAPGQPPQQSVYFKPLPVFYLDNHCSTSHDRDFHLLTTGPWANRRSVMGRREPTQPPEEMLSWGADIVWETLVARPAHPRIWLLTCRQIYAEAHPLIGIHQPSLHFCYAEPMKRYLTMFRAHPLVNFTITDPQNVLSVSLCVSVGIKAVEGIQGRRYALVMSYHTGWEGGHGDVFCNKGCQACSGVRGMPTDLRACFPRLRTLKLAIGFQCVEEETEETIGTGDGRRMFGNSTVKTCVKGQNTLSDRLLENTSVMRGEEAVGGVEEGQERDELIVEWICRQQPLWGFVGKKLDNVEVIFKPGAFVPSWDTHQPSAKCWCFQGGVDEGDEIRGRLAWAIKRTLMRGKLRDEPRGYPFS